VALNRAVAIAMSEGAERGLALIDELGSASELEGYYLFHAARADLLRRLGKTGEAAEAYRIAIGLTTNAIEREHLILQLESISGMS
jgi:RNA polymerase sigma-70 factor (ECF subfamily)